MESAHLDSFLQWLKDKSIPYTSVSTRRSPLLHRIIFVLEKDEGEILYKQTPNGQFKKIVWFNIYTLSSKEKKKKTLKRKKLFG